ncbi:hypothetical protein Raf01_28400 [Rugosimonospora africana]|uniref:Uncharacterized protein n=1 Tax=Rugosimonospora africana TaxID=556532 RepID=A0A8J3VQT3_9ACTN|nr:hypothetical protein Raf01_28400 [Rugosimonospora africana]
MIVCSDGVGPAAGSLPQPAAAATSATAAAIAVAGVARRRPIVPVLVVPVPVLVVPLPVVITVDPTTFRARSVPHVPRGSLRRPLLCLPVRNTNGVRVLPMGKQSKASTPTLPGPGDSGSPGSAWRSAP